MFAPSGGSGMFSHQRKQYLGVSFREKRVPLPTLAFFSEFVLCWRLDHRFSFSRFLHIQNGNRRQSPLEVRYWRCSEVYRHAVLLVVLRLV